MELVRDTAVHRSGTWNTEGSWGVAGQEYSCALASNTECNRELDAAGQGYSCALVRNMEYRRELVRNTAVHWSGIQSAVMRGKEILT